MPPAIQVENLGKAYRIGLKETAPDTFMGLLSGIVKAPLRNFKNLASLDTSRADSTREQEGIVWALKDVSFEVQHGEVLGIIGHNGAGKSTLLKILSRITEPTTGRAVINGRVSSLLEVGTGFHPELSGRDNIYMNGTILGMSKREIDRKLDEIIEFSGVEKFLDTPTKRYSSGMKVRLAFAVAAHLEPEILIIDEVLAVGDQEFQNKCVGKMKDVAGHGRTVMFVSHNMAAVEVLCSRAILLKYGSIAITGDVSEITREYLSPSSLNCQSDFGCYRSDNGLIREINLLNAENISADRIGAGKDAAFNIKLESDKPLRALTIRIVLVSATGVRVCNCNSRIETNRLFNCSRETSVTCTLPGQRLATGRYTVSVGVFHHGQELQSVEQAFEFKITPTDIFGTGLLPSTQKAVYLPHSVWSFAEEGMAIADQIQH